MDKGTKIHVVESRHAGERGKVVETEKRIGQPDSVLVELDSGERRWFPSDWLDKV